MKTVAGEPYSNRWGIAGRLGFSERHVHATALALLPWLCLGYSRDWIYSAAGTIDPWVYHGYFHRFPEFVSNLYPGLYYGTRLAWIVPGYLTYALFPPHVANLVLHLGVYYLAVFAIYRVVAILADRGIALLAALAFGTHRPILIALGWDYVDGAVIAYSTVAWACLLSAARSSSPSWRLVAAGGASAAMVHSNLGTLILAPGLLVSYVSLRGREPLPAVLARGGALLAGAALVTAVLGAFDAWAGGPWLFFMPSVRWTADSLGVVTFDPKLLLARPIIAQLVLPVLGALVALGLLAMRRSSATVAASAPILLTIALFAVFDAAFRGGLLQTFYYVNWLLAPALVTLAIAVSPSSGRHARMRVAAFVVLMSLANALIESPQIFRAGGVSRTQFDLVQQTIRFVSKQVPIERGRPLFWLEPVRRPDYMSSLLSTHLFLYSLAGTEYPMLPHDVTTSPRAGATITPGSTVVIISYGEPNPSTIEQEFAKFGLTTRMGAREAIQAGRVRFLLSVVDIEKR